MDMRIEAFWDAYHATKTQPDTYAEEAVCDGLSALLKVADAADTEYVRVPRKTVEDAAWHMSSGDGPYVEETYNRLMGALSKGESND